MSRPIGCPLCSAPATDLIDDYFHCLRCDLRFLDPRLHLDSAAEKQRYELHNNTFEDPRYRQFLEPLALALKSVLPPPGEGLDFGAGPAPVLADILRTLGYTCHVYDPFFHPDSEALRRSYDFVCASEVAEHMFSPAAEFRRLRGLLRPGGVLAVMTALYNSEIDFATWYYRKDPTHVVFYSQTTFVWLAQAHAFESPQFRGDRIVLLKASS